MSSIVFVVQKGAALHVFMSSCLDSVTFFRGNQAQAFKIADGFLRRFIHFTLTSAALLVVRATCIRVYVSCDDSVLRDT